MFKFISILAIFCAVLFSGELEFNTLQSDFTQSVKSQSKTISYHGYFVADSKKAAFWNYEKPIKKLVYFSYENIVLIEPDLEQAFITKISDVPNILQILSNATKIASDLYETEFDSIKYKIKVNSGLPIEIKYTDKFDNEVTISLKNTKKNQKINQNLLMPKIPENFDIIEN